MRPLPYIAPIENVSDLLDLLGSSKLFSQRLKDLNEVQEEIDRALSSYKKWGEIEEVKNQSILLLEETKTVQQQANAFREHARKAADAMIADAKADLDKQRAEIAAQKDELQKEQNELIALKASIENLKAEAETIRADANRKFVEANKQLSEANSVRGIFEGKLKKMQEAVA